MLDLKPYGAFIENTIRPMIEEAQTLLSDLYAYGLHLEKEDLFRMAKIVGKKHLIVTVINALRDIIIAIIIAGTLWKTLA